MSKIKMKPFNLERALAGDPVVYRNGEKVEEILALKTPGVNYPVFSVVKGGVCSHNADGSQFRDRQPADQDLFMVARTKTLWVNVYHSVSAPTGLSVIGYLYATKEEAETNRGSGSISAPVEVEY